MLRLERLHPISQLVFFVSALIVPLTFNNPFFSAASLICAMLYIIVRDGKKSYKPILFAVAVTAFVSCFNMLFAHYGKTVLFIIKGVNFTYESLFYGFSQGMTVAGALIWFTVFAKCVDSERLIYLFRFAPKTALIISMVLGFIPRFAKKSQDIRDARIALDGGKTPDGLKEKLNFTTENFSALVSYSLESSIITSQSMEARGYNPKAIRASGFRMSGFDIAYLSCNILIIIFLFIQLALGNIRYVFEPVGYIKALSIPALILFLVIGLYPSIIELREKIKWKLLSVKA